MDSAAFPLAEPQTEGQGDAARANVSRSDSLGKAQESALGWLSISQAAFGGSLHRRFLVP